MQPKIEKEVAFLQRLRRRFAHQDSYKSVISDMHDEGLITDVAYRKIMSLYSKPTPRTKSVVKTSVIKKTANSLKPTPTYGSCGGGSGCDGVRGRSSSCGGGGGRNC